MLNVRMIHNNTWTLSVYTPWSLRAVTKQSVGGEACAKISRWRPSFPFEGISYYREKERWGIEKLACVKPSYLQEQSHWFHEVEERNLCCLGALQLPGNWFPNVCYVNKVKLIKMPSNDA